MAAEESDAAVPPAARLLRDFVNTYEPQVDVELVGTPDRLHAWLTDHELLAESTDLTDEQVAEATAVREGLRSVLAGNAGHGVDPERVADLNRQLRDVPLRAEIDVEGLRLVPADPGPFPTALALLLDAVRSSQADDSWRRLKVCDRDTCRWAYYDSSRNQVRRWCSMAGCGNYVKMRRRAAGRSAAS
jgi:predicted RNA-binding Zn ribbon-like protein